jgi:hypothetical protein
LTEELFWFVKTLNWTMITQSESGLVFEKMNSPNVRVTFYSDAFLHAQADIGKRMLVFS